MLILVPQLQSELHIIFETWYDLLKDMDLIPNPAVAKPRALGHVVFHSPVWAWVSRNAKWEQWQLPSPKIFQQEVKGAHEAESAQMGNLY